MSVGASKGTQPNKQEVLKSVGSTGYDKDMLGHFTVFGVALPQALNASETAFRETEVEAVIVWILPSSFQQCT